MKFERGSTVWLGRHTLTCGDATSSEDVRNLLADRKVDQLLTDPPYGADLMEKWISTNRIFLATGTRPGGYSHRKKGCENDAALTTREVDDYRVFFAAFLRRVPWNDPNTAYVFMSSAHLHNLRLAFEDAGLHTSDNLIWLKDRFVLGRRDYHSKYETIVYGWSGRHKFHGKKHQTNVLEHKRGTKHRWHPCEKPLGLVSRLIENGAPAEGVVYDPFAGGGTTILAAEATGRTCYAMEIDPAQCARIMERWEQRHEEGA